MTIAIRKAVFPVAAWAQDFCPQPKAMPERNAHAGGSPLDPTCRKTKRALPGSRSLFSVTSRGKGALEDHFDSKQRS